MTLRYEDKKIVTTESTPHFVCNLCFADVETHLQAGGAGPPLLPGGWLHLKRPRFIAVVICPECRPYIAKEFQ